MDRRRSSTNDRKASTGKTPGKSKGDAPRSIMRSACSTNSRIQATSSEARSRRKRPGTMRRRGFTAKSVMAMENCAMGFLAGARMTCIQKRTNAARITRSKIVSRTRAKAWAIIAASLLAQRVAQLAGTLAGRLHRLDEALLHVRGVQQLH